MFGIVAGATQKRKTPANQNHLLHKEGQELRERN